MSFFKTEVFKVLIIVCLAKKYILRNNISSANLDRLAGKPIHVCD